MSLGSTFMPFDHRRSLFDSGATHLMMRRGLVRAPDVPVGSTLYSLGTSAAPVHSSCALHQADAVARVPAQGKRVSLGSISTPSMYRR